MAVVLLYVDNIFKYNYKTKKFNILLILSFSKKCTANNDMWCIWLRKIYIYKSIQITIHWNHNIAKTCYLGPLLSLRWRTISLAGYLIDIPHAVAYVQDLDMPVKRIESSKKRFRRGSNPRPCG